MCWNFHNIVVRLICFLLKLLKRCIVMRCDLLSIERKSWHYMLCEIEANIIMAALGATGDDFGIVDKLNATAAFHDISIFYLSI